MVSWSALATTAREQAREKDIRQWANTFDLYKGRFVVWPVMPSANNSLGSKAVCLGTFVTDSSNSNYSNGRCIQYASALLYRNASTADTNWSTLKTEIQRVGNWPENSSQIIKNVAAGPFLYVWQTSSSNTYTVRGEFIGFFERSCPSGFTQMTSSNPDVTNYAALNALLLGVPSSTYACSLQKTLTYTTS